MDTAWIKVLEYHFYGCMLIEKKKLQMAVAIKKILYAVDAKESALEEAEEYISQSADSGETEEGKDN